MEITARFGINRKSVLQQTIAKNRKQHQKPNTTNTSFFFRGTANDNEKNYYYNTIDTVTMMNHITMQCIYSQNTMQNRNNNSIQFSYEIGPQ